MPVKQRGKGYEVSFQMGQVRFRRIYRVNRADAVAIEAALRAKVARGDVIDDLDQIRFDEFAGLYHEYEESALAQRTVRNHDYHRASLFVPFFGDRLVSQVTPAIIERYKQQRVKAGIAPATVNRDLNELAAMFNKAIDWKHCRSNPVGQVDRLKVPKRHAEYYETVEVLALLQAARESDNAQDYALLCVAVNTGIRKDELLHLEWSDIDFNRREIVVQPKEGWNTKDHEPRSIPMRDEVYEALRAHPRHFRASWVFWTGNGQRMCTVQGYERAVTRAGIRRLRFHDLRHTFASHMVMGGVDLSSLAKLLGHATTAMTQVYAHLSSGHLETAIRRLSWSDSTPAAHVPTVGKETP